MATIAEKNELKKVITWSAPSGEKLNVCLACETHLGGAWPRNNHGEEYCQVSHGLHLGQCDICDDATRPDGSIA